MGSKDPNFLGKLKNAWDLEFKNNPQKKNGLHKLLI
jgi:hypothetical protein